MFLTRVSDSMLTARGEEWVKVFARKGSSVNVYYVCTLQRKLYAPATLLHRPRFYARVFPLLLTTNHLLFLFFPLSDSRRASQDSSKNNNSKQYTYLYIHYIYIYAHAILWIYIYMYRRRWRGVIYQARQKVTRRILSVQLSNNVKLLNYLPRATTTAAAAMTIYYDGSGLVII